MNVKLIKHVNVYEKELMYLQLENDNGKRTVINIGQKTWDNVSELITDEIITTKPANEQVENNSNSQKRKGS